MSEKLADRKKQILKIALQLFSTQGISATSMQEIAEHCGMSKGSLYLHFKSKEELEQSIYLYCEGMIRDSVMQVEQEHLLTPKERLRKQIETLLNRLVELREFLQMQMRDHHGGAKQPGHQECMREKHIHALNWFRHKLESLYGPSVEPYTMDISLFVGGMLVSYLRMMFMPGLQLNIGRMADHLIFLLDEIISSTVAKQSPPLISRDIWSHWIEKYMVNTDGPRHPLTVMKHMRDKLKTLDIEDQERELAFESLEIMEKEFLDMQPRQAILTGMMNNLEQIAELAEMNQELRDINKLYLVSRSDRI